MTRHRQNVSVVADIGGTNTRVALSREGRILPQTLTRYLNAEIGDLSAALSDFRRRHNVGSVEAVAGAAAGILRDGGIRMTNLDWYVDAGLLCAATGARRGVVFNDLQAQAHGVETVQAAHRITILDGQPAQSHAPVLVAGVGTGFNMSVLHRLPGGPVALPAEAGQARLTVTGRADWEVIEYISRRHGFPAVEEVLSGKGLGRLYTLLGGFDPDGRECTAEEVFADLRTGKPDARRALDMFCRLLGNTLGDLALSVLPHGGIFLVGGMAQALADLLPDSPFEEAFRGKGRFRPLMHEFSVTVIADDFAALNGCAQYLSRMR